MTITTAQATPIPEAVIAENSETHPSETWLRLVEYGDHPHPKGLQKVTRKAAQTMVQAFHSLRGKLCRRFGGLPLYIGHPDDPALTNQAGHRDSRAYAWIHDIEAREDGIYIQARWSKIGRELISNALYKYLSPRWRMSPENDGSYSPSELISVGLTNTPNIPGHPIANSKEVAAQNPDAETIQVAREQIAVLEERINRLESRLDQQSALAKTAPATSAANALPTTSKLEGLNHRQVSDISRAAAAERHMAETGEDYASAWKATGNSSLSL